MEPDKITQNIRSIREDLGYKRGVDPIIDESHVGVNGHIIAVVPDRAEKSLCLGPGGWIVAEFAKRTGSSITFYGRDELALRRQRLIAALTRLKDIEEQAEIDLQPFLRMLSSSVRSSISFPRRPLVDMAGIRTKGEIAVALSGGMDSAASLVLCREWSPCIVAMTADLGPEVLSEDEKRHITSWCNSLEILHEFLSIQEEIEPIHISARFGDIHPCGACHEKIIRRIRDRARRRGIGIVITGELLPTGRQSIEYENDLLVIHLPALFSLSKHDTKTIFQETELRQVDNGFGCRFLTSLHSHGWAMVGPSLFRVLRELEAGILTTGQALEFSKNIVKSALKSRSNSAVRRRIK